MLIIVVVSVSLTLISCVRHKRRSVFMCIGLENIDLFLFLFTSHRVPQSDAVIRRKTKKKFQDAMQER